MNRFLIRRVLGHFVISHVQCYIIINNVRHRILGGNMYRVVVATLQGKLQPNNDSHISPHINCCLSKRVHTFE